MNLDRLEQLANAAAEHTEDRWRVLSNDDFDMEVIGATAGPSWFTPVCSVAWNDDSSVADYIAAVDPQTVKGLIAVARAARNLSVVYSQDWAGAVDDVAEGALIRALEDLDELEAR